MNVMLTGNKKRSICGKAMVDRRREGRMVVIQKAALKTTQPKRFAICQHLQPSVNEIPTRAGLGDGSGTKEASGLLVMAMVRLLMVLVSFDTVCRGGRSRRHETAEHKCQQHKSKNFFHKALS
ncbi:MAG TPA: hypothetical protein VGI03_05740 [Verrucomicrobiae bacterium]|jgi:hypothetical protein